MENPEGEAKVSRAAGDGAVEVVEEAVDAVERWPLMLPSAPLKVPAYHPRLIRVQLPRRARLRQRQRQSNLRRLRRKFLMRSAGLFHCSVSWSSHQNDDP